jgi:SPP1 gp7 family putative phage head morphogenesis protein
MALNVKDPSGLRATEDRRAAESVKDLDATIDRILDKIESENVTDPARIHEIVTSEMKGYDQDAKDKVNRWVKDTWSRAGIRAQTLIKAAGGKIVVSGAFGANALTPEEQKTVEINVKNTIGSLSADVQKKLTSTILDGMKEGNGPRVIAKSISENIGMERSRAELIARDQTMKAYRESSTAQYDRHGIKEEKWLTAHDDRTCDECAALDGTVYPIGERPHVHGGTDIQCRCVGLPVIPDLEDH